MAKLNLSQAAKAVGKSRVTIWRHINAGKLSAARDRDGNPCIDTSELLRVYGELLHDETHRNTKKKHHETLEYDELVQLITSMKKEQEEMKELIISLRNRLEHKQEQTTTELAPQKLSAENDPEWPKTVESMQDLVKRRELREKYALES